MISSLTWLQTNCSGLWLSIVVCDDIYLRVFGCYCQLLTIHFSSGNLNTSNTNSNIYIPQDIKEIVWKSTMKLNLLCVCVCVCVCVESVRVNPLSNYRNGQITWLPCLTHTFMFLIWQTINIFFHCYQYHILMRKDVLLYNARTHAHTHTVEHAWLDPPTSTISPNTGTDIIWHLSVKNIWITFKLKANVFIHRVQTIIIK